MSRSEQPRSQSEKPSDDKTAANPRSVSDPTRETLDPNAAARMKALEHLFEAKGIGRATKRTKEGGLISVARTKNKSDNQKSTSSKERDLIESIINSEKFDQTRLKREISAILDDYPISDSDRKSIHSRFIELVTELMSSASVAHNAAHSISGSLSAVALPIEAPETFQGLRGPETPPEFVKRVYGPWLGQGLTRADIRKLDPKLSVAITNWLSRPGNEWPADVDLPTKAEQNERLLSAGSDAIREHLGKFTGQEALREAARINAAAHYRK